MEIVSADIGGTHARFAIAEVEYGQVVSLDEPLTLKVHDYPSLPVAWTAFGEHLGRVLPRAAAIAVASPMDGDVIRMTNSPWVIRPSLIRQQLGIDTHLLINDFGAIGHAVAQLPDHDFAHICGPDVALPTMGVTTVCGPGTGLGVAQVFRYDGHYHVLETEGGHVDFAPLDAFEDALIARLRRQFSRVSIERIVGGPGIAAIYETLVRLEGRSDPTQDDRAIWKAAFAGSDPIAIAAVDRFCMALGAVAGDLALVHGAHGVVIAGGLGLRLENRLRHSAFGRRFQAKGRFAASMARIPVKLITHPQPGLFGAAAGYARAYPG